ncbi:MAG: DUF5668 domain-containing protein [bacterium]
MTTSEEPIKAAPEQDPVRPTYAYRYRRHHGRPVFAVILIGAGILFLLNNYGALDLGLAVQLWRLWPLLLVLWGLQAAVGRSRVGSFLVFLIGLLLICGVILLGLGQVPSRVGEWFTPKTETKQVQLPVPTASPAASSRTLNVSTGYGKLQLDDLGGDKSASLKSYATGMGGSPTLTQNTTNGKTVIDLTVDQNSISFSPAQPEYDLSLGQTELVTDLNLRLGAGSAGVQFNTLKVGSLGFDMGAGSAAIKLGKESVPTGAINLKVGTGTLDLVVPDGIGINLVYHVGLGLIKADGTILHGDGTFGYATPSYSNASKKITIVLTVGAGTVNISAASVR